MYLSAGRRRQRGKHNGMGTEEDAGMRRGSQGRAVEAGKCQVQAAPRWATPRWAALCTRKGGGYRVKREGFDEGAAADREAVGKRGVKNDPEKREEKGGAEELV